MPRTQGTFLFSENLEVKKSWTLDARQLVKSYNDLLSFDSTNYITEGFPVNVYDVDITKRGIYMCINASALSNPNSWLKIGSFSESYIPKIEAIILDGDGTKFLNDSGEYVEVQIIQEQSDWAETNFAANSFIKNKPNVFLYELLSNKNSSNGYAGLIDGKININQLPDFLLGNVKFKGTYNGTIIVTSHDNSLVNQSLPTPIESNVGWYFICVSDFTYQSLDYKIGDWIISNGTSGWTKIDNTDALISFNGRIGAIILNSQDVTDALGFTPVTNQRTISINNISYDLSANRTWDLTTDNIPQGTNNFYYSTSNFNRDFSDKTTDNLSEGTNNLYFLNSRSREAISFLEGAADYDNTTGILKIPTKTSHLENDSEFLTISSISGTAPISFNERGEIIIEQADSTTNGFLSSTDWNTFNEKQNALGFTPVPNSRAITINNVTYDLTQDRSWNFASYSLPIATASILGGIKIGAGISIDSNGVISVSTNFQSPLNGTGIVLSDNGTISYVQDNSSNWNNAYTRRIANFSTNGNVGAASFISNILNIPNYTLEGLGGQPKLSGNGFIKISGETITYDNSTYLTTSSANSNYQTILVSTENIKSINGNSILGVGNISVATLIGFTPYNSTNPNNYISLNSITGVSPISFNQTNGQISIQQANGTQSGFLALTDWNVFNSKQENLVSGSNIKTINGETILGSGNLSVSGTISGLTTNRIPFASSSTNVQDDSQLYWDNTNKILNSGNRLSVGASSANTNLISAFNETILPGTVSTIGSDLVTGTGTKFLEDFRSANSGGFNNLQIIINGVTYNISSVTSDTILRVTTGIPTLTNVSYSTTKSQRFRVRQNGDITIYGNILDVNGRVVINLLGNTTRIQLHGSSMLDRDYGILFPDRAVYFSPSNLAQDVSIKRLDTNTLMVSDGGLPTVLTNFKDLRLRTLISDGVVRLKSYTVATLPSGTTGDTAYVTDALVPTFMGIIAGGGSTVARVFFNGTNWIA